MHRVTSSLIFCWYLLVVDPFWKPEGKETQMIESTEVSSQALIRTERAEKEAELGKERTCSAVIIWKTPRTSSLLHVHHDNCELVVCKRWTQSKYFCPLSLQATKDTSSTVKLMKTHTITRQNCTVIKFMNTIFILYLSSDVSIFSVVGSSG